MGTTGARAYPLTIANMENEVDGQSSKPIAEMSDGELVHELIKYDDGRRYMTERESDLMIEADKRGLS